MSQAGTVPGPLYDENNQTSRLTSDNPLREMPALPSADEATYGTM